MERPEKAVRIRDFKGLVSNRGALVGDPGAAKVQTNLRCLAPGRLESRSGMRPVKFDA